MDNCLSDFVTKFSFTYEKSYYHSLPKRGGVIALLLFCSILTQAQNVFNATTASITDAENLQLLTKMTAYQTFQFDSDSLYKVVQVQGENVGFQLNIDQYSWSFSLKPYDIYSLGATIAYTGQNGFHMEEAGPSDTYKGTLTSDTNAVLRLLISGNTFTGFIRTPTETYRINPIGFWVTNPVNPNIFVIIKESQLTEPPMNEPWCPTSGDEQGGSEVVFRGEETLYIDLAVDCNYEMLVKHGSYSQTLEAVTDYIMNVDERYAAELNIRVLLGHVHIWMEPSPFEGPLSANNAWNAFKNYWNANNACINRDVAVLLKGNSGGGWLGYVKDSEGFGAVCVGRATSYALVVESGNTARTIGHELGHWLSAGHTPAGECSSNCYVMCQSPNCSAAGSDNTSWTFSQNSKNKINFYLTSNDPLIVNYRHDWCLGSKAGITGPDRLCLDQEGTYSYNSFLAGTQFPGEPSHELLWTTGPGLTIAGQDNAAQTVTVKGTGSGMSTWVGVQLSLTPTGVSNGLGCSNGAPIVKKQVHAGLPLSAGTPNITSYWVPGYPTGSFYYDIGFGAPESATEYQYTYQVYNVQYPGTYSGVTTDINPLITNIPQDGCFTATVLAGNECGFLTPEQTTNFPVTICFNNPLKKPDGSEVLIAEVAGEQVAVPVQNSNKSRLAGTHPTTVAGNQLPSPPSIPLREAVFPNPASDKVTLQLPHELSRVIVQDAAGRIVATYELGAGLHEISSKDWRAGIYFLTVRTEATSNTHRFVIQH